SAGMRARRWTSALVVGELVLTLVLLSGAVFMMRSFMSLYRIDYGFDTSRLLTMRLYLPLTQYPDPEPRMRLFEEMERRLAEAPGLESSALATAPPLSGGGRLPLLVEGGDASTPVELRALVTTLTISEQYVATRDLTLLQGRPCGPEDGTPGSGTAIVNQRFADLHLGGDDLGRRVRLGVASPEGTEPPWLTVVGAAPNVRQNADTEREPDPI